MILYNYENMTAHVWQDSRFYVYPSHDVAPPRGCDLMDQYHVYSTDDMVHWTDHGEILRARLITSVGFHDDKYLII